jgi:ribosomal protein S27AE
LLSSIKYDVEMTEPKQACPRCGVDLGKLLYCTPLKNIKFFCPNCGLQVQMKCPKCGNWMVMIEQYCGKCGAKNPCFYRPK